MIRWAPTYSPTYSELLAKLREFGGQVHTRSGAIQGPRGDVLMLCVKRADEHGSYVAALQEHHDGQRLAPRVAVSILRQLHIPVEEVFDEVEIADLTVSTRGKS